MAPMAIGVILVGWGRFVWLWGSLGRLWRHTCLFAQLFLALTKPNLFLQNRGQAVGLAPSRSVLPPNESLQQITGTKNRLPSLSLLICGLIKIRKNEHYSNWKHTPPKTSSKAPQNVLKTNIKTPSKKGIGKAKSRQFPTFFEDNRFIINKKNAFIFFTIVAQKMVLSTAC